MAESSASYLDDELEEEAACGMEGSAERVSRSASR